MDATCFVSALYHSSAISCSLFICVSLGNHHIFFLKTNCAAVSQVFSTMFLSVGVSHSDFSIRDIGRVLVKNVPAHFVAAFTHIHTTGNAASNHALTHTVVGSTFPSAQALYIAHSAAHCKAERQTCLAHSLLNTFPIVDIQAFQKVGAFGQIATVCAISVIHFDISVSGFPCMSCQNFFCIVHSACVALSTVLCHNHFKGAGVTA